jgi:hypothetical protein
MIQLPQLIPTEIRPVLGRVTVHHFTARHLFVLEERNQDSIRGISMYLYKEVDDEV